MRSFAMAFLRMVPGQNWLTRRDHFKSFPGGEVSPGWNVLVLLCELPKARSFFFAARSDSKSFMLEEVGLQLQIMCLDSVGCDRRDALIKEHPKRLAVGQLDELSELDALLISQSFGLVHEIKVCVRFERKNVGLKTLRQEHATLYTVIPASELSSDLIQVR
jgi:hypothetical protein